MGRSKDPGSILTLFLLFPASNPPGRVLGCGVRFCGAVRPAGHVDLSTGTPLGGVTREPTKRSEESLPFPNGPIFGASGAAGETNGLCGTPQLTSDFPGDAAPR